MKIHIHRPATDDEAAPGDYFAEGLGVRHGIMAAAAALFVLALFLPAEDGEPGWRVGFTTWWAAVESAGSSRWQRFWATAPWYASFLLAIGFRRALEGRFRQAGLWSVGAAALALVIAWREPQRWGASPAYLVWIGAMAVLAALLFFPGAPRTAPSVLRDDPPRY